VKIGIIIGRIGGVDGVALETEKWIEVLHRMGHEVYILSGQFEEVEIDTEHQTLLPLLSFFSPECVWEQNAAFFHPIPDPAPLLEKIDAVSDIIAQSIKDWVAKNQIQCIISENASALPSHLSMGVGIGKAVDSLGIPTITHDHDYAWERGDRYVSPHEEINQLVANSFPLRLPNVKYAVINQHAKGTLKEKFGIHATVVPNVMDFDKPYGEKTTANRSLLADLGLEDTAIPLFQVTRIVERKGIEVAIDLLHQLADSRIKLVITGSHKDDEGGKYYNSLINQIHQLKLTNQVLFTDNVIQNHGWKGHHGSIKYSLSDAYAYARACTYFSTYEGFGNAFVEAVLAKKPIFVNNYKPVYMPDIGSKGFKTVMLENNELTDSAVSDMKKVIFDETLAMEIGEYNYAIGEKHFSYNVLQEILQGLITE